MAADPTQDTHPDAAEKRARAVEALKLRIEGKTWDQIAEATDYHDRSSAYRAVKTLLLKRETETAEEYRELISTRYEALFAKSWEQIEAASDKGQLVGKSQLLTAARGILDSHARLLGIANPKVEVSGDIKYSNPELDAQIEKLIGIVGQGPANPRPAEEPEDAEKPQVAPDEPQVGAGRCLADECLLDAGHRGEHSDGTEVWE